MMPTSDPATAGRIGRRALLGAALLLGAAGVYALDRRFRFPQGPEIDPPAAHRRATTGDLLLIDIRRPDEWAATGIGAGAQLLDMRREDFTGALLALAAGDRGAPIALICARGVRSARLAARLRGAGFTAVLDVAEGMLGGATGPGWIARGLPLRRG